jgi:nitronate monooxygenase
MDITDRFRLDIPVGQSGMGGGLAGAPRAAAIAEAGGLGTIGIATPRQLRTSIDRVREQERGRGRHRRYAIPV